MIRGIAHTSKRKEAGPRVFRGIAHAVSWYRPQNFVVSPTPHFEQPLFYGAFPATFRSVTGCNTLINLLTPAAGTQRTEEAPDPPSNSKVARGYASAHFGMAFPAGKSQSKLLQRVAPLDQARRKSTLRRSGHPA